MQLRSPSDGISLLIFLLWRQHCARTSYFYLFSSLLSLSHLFLLVICCEATLGPNWTFPYLGSVLGLCLGTEDISSSLQGTKSHHQCLSSISSVSPHRDSWAPMPPASWFEKKFLKQKLTAGGKPLQWSPCRGRRCTSLTSSSSAHTSPEPPCAKHVCTKYTMCTLLCETGVQRWGRRCKGVLLQNPPGNLQVCMASLGTTDNSFTMQYLAILGNT